jgi:hypothetical protein
MAAKDKAPVQGEPMPEAQFRALLDFPPEEGEDPDFHVLLRAYRGMTPEDFARFIAFFREHGRDLNAQDPKGRTLKDVISRHRHAGPYIEVLEEAGAR